MIRAISRRGESDRSVRLGRLAGVLLAGLSACAAPRVAGTSAAGETAAVRFAAWTPATFERARSEGRPVLVHVAATWCHWCHVMERETYGDPEVAALLDEAFVAVRVDSDRRPDVAERYAAWGWPATALLTPDGSPITELRGYQEKGPFLELLRGVRDDVRAGRPVARRAAPVRRRTGDADLARAADFAAARLDALYDARLGGWGTFQKYPLAAPVEELLRRARTRGDADARRRALTTLRAELALADRVDGGLFQYSVPETWDRPHFEKLATVQAGALENFAAASALDTEGAAAWLAEAARVRGYVGRFLRDATGAFLASQDADPPHGPDGASEIDGRAYYARDAAGRAVLGAPRVDPEPYADVNGRLATAFLALYARTGDVSLVADATRAIESMFASRAAHDGAWRHGAATSDSALFLTDQMHMGRALLALYEATGDRSRLDAALATARFVLARLEDPVEGGLFSATTPPGATGVLAERRAPFEANAVTARWLLRLAKIAAAPEFAAAAERALRRFADEEVIRAEGRDVGDYLLALREFLEPAPRLTVVAGPDAAETNAFARAVLGLAVPGAAVERRIPDAEFPALPTPALYVCTEGFCSAPMVDVARLGDDVARVLGRTE